MYNKKQLVQLLSTRDNKKTRHLIRITAVIGKHMNNFVLNTTITKLLFMGAVLSLITGCSNIAQQKSETPSNLLAGALRDKLSNIMSELQHENTTVGRTLSSSDSFGSGYLGANEKSFKGFRIVVQGNAFNQGFLGPPSLVSIDGDSTKSNTAGTEYVKPFITTGIYTYAVTYPDLQCGKNTLVRISALALRAGDSDYEMQMVPLDNTIPPAIFKHTCTIGESRVTSPTPATTFYMGRERKQRGAETQYELGARQEAIRQRMERLKRYGRTNSQ
jgi:hypothetical protein